jgi:hypothetical protein
MSKYLYLKIVSTSKYGAFGKKNSQKNPLALSQPPFVVAK